MLAFRYPLNTALTVSASLAQIGEFSFILAGLGVSLGLLPAEGQSLILAGAIVSIALNPLLFQAIEPAQHWIRSRSTARAQRWSARADPLAELPMTVDPAQLTGHVVIVGYGRVGRRIAKRCRPRRAVRRGRAESRARVSNCARGQAAVFGDAAEPMVLVQAHVAERACW